MESCANRIELAPCPDNPHFIGSWIIEPRNLCDQLIEFFEAHPENQTLGKTAAGLNPASKQSTDLTIRPRELQQPDHQPVRQYLDALYACQLDYLAQWPFLQGVLPRVDIGSFNIQRYDPGGHFMKVHSERTTLATSHRILAWMTYLNDVETGGCTRFVHQNLEVKPQRGKLSSGRLNGPMPTMPGCWNQASNTSLQAGCIFLRQMLAKAIPGVPTLLAASELLKHGDGDKTQQAK